MSFVQMIITATFLTVAISLDSASAGFAYGANKTKVPFINLFVLSIIDTIVLTLSLLLGDVIGRVISQKITLIISCSILCAMGLWKIFQWFRKRKKGITYKEKTKISWKETILLALALSIDGIAVGVGIAISQITTIFLLIVIAFSIFTDIIIFSAGSFIGKKISQKTRLDLSWLSGLVFIAIAIQKIFI